MVATSGEPEVGIVIEKVDADKDGTAVLEGRSDAGATLHASIDGTAAGEATVGSDGKWVLTLKNDTDKAAGGVLLVLSGADGKELDRADVPLKLAANPVKTAAAAAAAASIAAAALASSPANAVTPATVQKGHYVKVRRGDSLWRIAKRYYGNGRRWTRIYNANRRKIQDPDFLKPGRRIYLPD
jgi:nucleoid-associated protein YgaU